jgi:C_GCAxxG_C_C family probable redox protein
MVTASALRRRGTANLLRMGHCAPTIVQTLLDAQGTTAPWLVKLAAGLPGGIGNTGGECGGVTGPLIMLGLRHGLAMDDDGLPQVVTLGRNLVRRLEAAQGSSTCRDIRGEARVPLRCIAVVRQAPVLCTPGLDDDGRDALSPQQRQAGVRLVAHWQAAGFHCAHAVLRALGPAFPVDDQVLAASAAFMGGTALAGRTCSALTAGVMALGLALGEIEHSRLRVLRMIGTMAVGGQAFDDRLNAFNQAMNLGHELARWFAAEFGSTQCRQLTQCDFASASGVQRYIDEGRCAGCQAMARGVAGRVSEVVAAHRAKAGPPAGPG